MIKSFLKRALPEAVIRRIRTARPARPAFPVPAAPDRARFARDMAMALPQLGYVLHFTPRSGSSWLGDVLTRSRRLGIPAEAFNPNLMPKMVQAMNAVTLDEYCEVLPRRRSRGDVWGFEITAHQIAAVFGDEKAFLARFGHLPAIWLVRRDIVAQGVSLAKMSATRLGHAPQADAGSIAAADKQLRYDAAAIRYGIEHVRNAEIQTEAMFARQGIVPLRMSYEENVSHPPVHLTKVVGHHVGLGRMRVRAEALASPHTPISTSLNIEFADRFRAENPGFVAELEAARAPMLERIRPYAPRRGATGI